MINHNLIDFKTNFIIKINDTKEGFCLEITDTNTNVINEIFKSTSYSLVQQEFYNTVGHINIKWFKLLKMSVGNANTQAIFSPTHYFNSEESS